MSGIKLGTILKAINCYETVVIESEFAEEFDKKKVSEFLKSLSKKQLEVKFDYMRTTNDGCITFGINKEIFDEVFFSINN